MRTKKLSAKRFAEKVLFNNEINIVERWVGFFKESKSKSTKLLM